MEKPSELRQRAQRYRRLGRQTTDPAAVRAICEVTRELELTAGEPERRRDTRERAHELWVERGCPNGHDVEIWLAAEREVDIQRRH